MPVNRNALIRYRTIDKCLQNKYRRWTLDDLVKACSDALYDYEGILDGVSKRTTQLDIQMMRSDKLGYNAPIVVIDKKYYTYEDTNYSITNIPLNDKDLDVLSEVVLLLKQFKGFTHFEDIGGIIHRLEDKIYSEKHQTKPIIDFEKNENLKGLEHLNTIYQAILNKKVLKLNYKSFKAKSAGIFYFHAYLLKEYRNRWFVIGRKNIKSGILTLALDRIVEIAESSDIEYEENKTTDFTNFFSDIIGVTKNFGRPILITFRVSHDNAPYVITKPFHHSQKIIEKQEYGIIFLIQVIPNFELYREILGFGKSIEVLAPEKIRNEIKEILSSALNQY